MLTYPVHQAADILFCKAELVPVGKDQLPHLELTRTIARRFNERYGPVFALPEGLLGEAGAAARAGRRARCRRAWATASRSTDTPDQVAAKVRAARTDSERRISLRRRKLAPRWPTCSPWPGSAWRNRRPRWPSGSARPAPPSSSGW